MTIRESTIAKLQQLPDSLLQQVSDFIDVLTKSQPYNSAVEHTEGEAAEAWAQWFEEVAQLEIKPTEPVSEYQEMLLTKYRQQGLDL